MTLASDQSPLQAAKLRTHTLGCQGHQPRETLAESKGHRQRKALFRADTPKMRLHLGRRRQANESQHIPREPDARWTH
jgi:hypothetical protein